MMFYMKRQSFKELGTQYSHRQKPFIKKGISIHFLQTLQKELFKVKRDLLFNVKRNGICKIHEGNVLFLYAFWTFFYKKGHFLQSNLCRFAKNMSWNFDILRSAYLWEFWNLNAYSSRILDLIWLSPYLLFVYYYPSKMLF